MAALLDEYEERRLHRLLVRGKLQYHVIEAYEKYREIRELRIPRSEDTALHVAVSGEWDIYAERMVAAAERRVLEIRNYNGETALHVAARLGNTYFCKCIAQKDVALIAVLNHFGETPLFSAVSRGNIKAFLYLYHLCQDRSHELPDQREMYTRKDGDTILHYAISEEYFDLAYVIVKKCPELMHRTNKDGFSPLHLLATKPSAFQSGVHFSGIFPKLVYPCIRVGRLAKILNLEEVPNPQLRWNAYLRPLKAAVTNFSILDVLAPVLCNDTMAGRIIYFVLVVLIGLPIVIAMFLCCFWPYILLRIPFGWAKNFSGYEEYVRLKHIKEVCRWSVEVMKEIVVFEFCHEEWSREDQPLEPTFENVEKPIFEAAKNGIYEMVSFILDIEPEAIFDANVAEKKNIVMLAVEHRQYRLYESLINNNIIKRRTFEQVDSDGNNLLHIAANLIPREQLWPIRGAALQMHMEVKWYEFVKKTMPHHLATRYNNHRETPTDLLQESHKSLLLEGRQWLINTSQSGSLVAALIATVAFATSTTIPGGLKQDSSVPNLEHKPIFIVSAISSLVALSSSMISVVMFMGILTSNFRLDDFRKDLPYKLLLGLILLLISIVSMIISFYAGHSFMLKQEFHQNTTLVYEIVCSFVVFFIIYKFPLNFEIVWTTLQSTKPPE